MILHALNQYYRRLQADPKADIPAFGFSVQKISFCVVLEPDGALHAFQPVVAEVVNGRPIAEQLVVPGQTKPSGAGINPGLLWDNATYMLAAPHPAHDSAWAAKRFEAFRRRHLEIEPQIGDPAFSAACRFLENWSPERLADHPELVDMTHNFGVFRLRAETSYVHERAAVRDWWRRQLEAAGDGPVGMCLVEGRNLPLARLHEPKIKGVAGAQSMGATLVAFNLDASESYGKTQAYNAPVSEQAAFQYATALNHLLGDNRRRIQVADTTVVFWTEQPTEAERVVPQLFAGTLRSRQAEDEELLGRVGAFLSRLRQGKPDPQAADLDRPDTPFYILGLAPNTSRLSVRFWLVSTVTELSAHLSRHVCDLDVVGLGDQVPVLGQLVRETAPPTKVGPTKGWPDDKKIPKTMLADLTYAVLTGRPYPQAFYLAILRRISAEQFATADKRKDWHAAMARRAAAVKACLNRNYGKEMSMSLDLNRPEPAYHLGRWFAVLEKTQQEAIPELNATIKDRFYTAASATPAAIFPRLITLNQHHLRKIKGVKKFGVGLCITREKQVQEIAGHLDGFPRHLNFEQQGLFHLGYYHQVQDLFTRKPDDDNDINEPSEKESE